MGAPSAGWTVRGGRCLCVFAFDVGREVDLRAAREIVGGRASAPPVPLQSLRSPLGFREEAVPVEVGGLRTDAAADVRVYDFGAVAVTLTLPLPETAADLAAFARTLDDDASVETAARGVAGRVLERLLAAVADPHLAEATTRYDVFHLPADGSPVPPAEVHEAMPRALASILRPETADPSDEEVADALRDRASRSPREAAYLDVRSAVVFGGDVGDVLAVLEFVTVQLLEMRYLDARIDEALERSYDLLGKAPWGLGLPGLHGAELDRVGRRRIDAVLLFEHVRNAPKLLDEPYLVRVYEEAAVRRRLPAWIDAILRKLDTLGTVYERLRDRAAIVRLEVLEWIVILLILVSIVLPFVIAAKP